MATVNGKKASSSSDEEILGSFKKATRSKKDQNTLREESKHRQKLLRSQMKELFAQLALSIRPPLDPKTEKTKAILQSAIDYIHHTNNLLDRYHMLHQDTPSSPATPTQGSSPQIPTPVLAEVPDLETQHQFLIPNNFFPHQLQPLHNFEPFYEPGNGEPLDLFQEQPYQGAMYFEKSRQLAPEDLPQEELLETSLPNGKALPVDTEKDPNSQEEETEEEKEKEEETTKEESKESTKENTKEETTKKTKEVNKARKENGQKTKPRVPVAPYPHYSYPVYFPQHPQRMPGAHIPPQYIVYSPMAPFPYQPYFPMAVPIRHHPRNLPTQTSKETSKNERVKGKEVPLEDSIGELSLSESDEEILDAVVSLDEQIPNAIGSSEE